jgi:DNA-directed RNA polymerase specialized sigma24 family protein
MGDVRSVTHWYGLLRDGDNVAAQRLWERYFPQLVKLAQTRLQGAKRITNDPEDIALSAFASFCRQAECGRFPNLIDRDDLWRLLVTLTIRKAHHAVRDQGRIKRGGATGLMEIDIEELIGSEPTPAFAAQVAEGFRQILDHLSEPVLQNIAIWKMEGYSNLEIAKRLGRAPRTIERKLSLIRQIWEREST